MAQQPVESEGHPLAVLCARLGARLDELGNAPLWSADDTEIADLVRVLEVQQRRLAAWQVRVVAEATRRDLAKTVAATGPVPWLSALVTSRPQQARRVCRLADVLDHQVAATEAAFAAGAVDAEQAQVIATAIHQLPDEVGTVARSRAEQILLGEADRFHAGVLAGLGHTLLERVAPEVAEARLGRQLARAEARDEQRRCWLTATTDHHGRTRLRGQLDTESWALVSAALEPLAAPESAVGPEGTTVRDDRSVGNRRADALVELSRRALNGDLPTRGGYPAHVAITIDHHRLHAGLGAGLLATGTPLRARDVRRIACDATVLPVLLGTDSIPLDAGRAARVFTKELRKAVEIRDIGCTFPGCARPSSWCQVHHIVHWLDGGLTSLDNAALLCGSHHRTLHQGDWTVRLGPDRRPQFIPPPWIDPSQRPRRNPLHLRL
ncbi:MAG TPA: DUF222 domain-containing protein [Nocardioidaceae bacterium]|nr:DUF222 domain-containing protein [Nocardioidaceae bacterium]